VNLTPRPTVIGRLAVLGLWIVANPQWLCCVIMILTLFQGVSLLPATAVKILIGLVTIGLGAVAWHFAADTKNVEKQALTSQQSSNYNYDQLKEVWPIQKENTQKISFALVLLTAVSGLVGATNGSVSGVAGTIILQLALTAATIAFILYYSRKAELIELVEPASSKVKNIDSVKSTGNTQESQATTQSETTE